MDAGVVFWDRDGDARLSSLAAFVTVNAVAEGDDAGGERRECDVVIIPLSEQSHHETEFCVVDNAVVSGAEDVVGHLSHQREQEVVDRPVIPAFWFSDAIVVFSG